MATDTAIDPAPAASSDAALLARFATGDPAAVTTLYDAHATGLFSLAVQIVNDQREAEAVVEATFVQARAEADRFDPTRGALGSWLLLITRRLAIERMRGGGDGEEADLATVTLPDPARRQVFDIRSTEEADRLRHALAALPRLQRLAVELAYFEGLTSSRIATRLEHPVEVIRERVGSALLALRADLEARG